MYEGGTIPTKTLKCISFKPDFYEFIHVTNKFPKKLIFLTFTKFRIVSLLLMHNQRVKIEKIKLITILMPTHSAFQGENKTYQVDLLDL